MKSKTFMLCLFLLCPLLIFFKPKEPRRKTRNIFTEQYFLKQDEIIVNKINSLSFENKNTVLVLLDSLYSQEKNQNIFS